MVDPIVERFKALIEEPLSRYPSPATVIDNWIIVCLKLEYKPSPSLKEECEDLEREIRRYVVVVKDKKTFLSWVADLVMFHRLMWEREDTVRDTKIPLQDRMKAAFEADMENDQRAIRKTRINSLFGLGEGSEAKIRRS